MDESSKGAGPSMVALADPAWRIPGAKPAPILRAAMSSLALGGAERIVAEWLSDEAAMGRPCQLAIAHDQAHEMPMHPSVAIVRRPRWMHQLPYWRSVGAHWMSLDPEAPVAAHLLARVELAALASQGVGLIPVLHNDPAGWKGRPELWPPHVVRAALGCAPFVERAARQVNPGVFWTSLRHRPRVPASACSEPARQAARARVGAGPEDFVVGMVGSVKAQKNYSKAVEVAAALGAMRRSKVLALGHSGPALSDLPAVLEAARRFGPANRFHWLGGSADVGAFLAGVDAFLSTSLHEGFPMAAMEALGAGIPVVAPSLPGFEGFEHPLLTLLPPDADPAAIAGALARIPPRSLSEAPPAGPSNRRLWSIPFGVRAAKPSEGLREVLFATANLNAGGAQRSLSNLLVHARSMAAASPDADPGLAMLGRAALVVCDDSPTHPEFQGMLRSARVPVEALGTSDPARAAEELIRRATERGAKAVVFWNADAKLKLLAAKFMPPSIAIVDVSPGDYAFEELAAAGGLATLADFSLRDYSARLARWVSKRPCGPRWLGAPAVFIPNGCPTPAHPSPAEPPIHPRFAVSGRIAPSKRLDVVLEAFALFRRSHPSASLHVAGQAEPRCEELASSLMAAHGAGQGVHWLGADPSLAFYAQPWSAQVTLGTAQGSPNAVLEALAAGVPALANDDGGTAYALGADEEGGPAGILLPEHPTAGQLAQAMELSLSEAEQAKWRARAAELSKGRHSMDAMVRSYASELQAAVQPPAEPAPGGHGGPSPLRRK